MTSKRLPLAGIFLGLLAIIIVAVIGFFVYLNLNQQALLALAFTPDGPIAEEQMAPAPDYASDSAWAARPGKASAVSFRPEGVIETAQVREVDVFYIHPTTYIPQATEEKRWNGSLDDPGSLKRTENFALRQQASAFALAGEVYAPRYRQAMIGAFFDTTGQGITAMLRAYEDIKVAFDHYMEHDNKGRPFLLVGHSQGSLMGMMLLRDRIANTSLRHQMVAAYLVGWPLSIEAEIEAMGLGACNAADETGCVISWQSFGQGGDPSMITTAFYGIPGLLGTSRVGSRILCTNPLTWEVDSVAARHLHTGGIVGSDDLSPLTAPEDALTGASCGTDGILYLNDPPEGEWRRSLMPGDNYHPMDINLFYMNVRENAALRARTFLNAARTGAVQ